MSDLAEWVGVIGQGVGAVASAAAAIAAFLAVRHARASAVESNEAAQEMARIESRRLHDELRPRVTVQFVRNGSGCAVVINRGTKAVRIVGWHVPDQSFMPERALFEGDHKEITLVPEAETWTDYRGCGVLRLAMDAVSDSDRCQCGRGGDGGHWVEDFPLLPAKPVLSRTTKKMLTQGRSQDDEVGGGPAAPASVTG